LNLTSIVKEEGIKLENDQLLKQLARQAHGSFRDALSLLDQVRAVAKDDYIDEEVVLLSLGMMGQKVILDLIDAVLACDAKTVTSIFHDHAQGIDPKVLSRQVLEALYDIISKGNFEGDMSEIYWIYEVFSKDSSWIVESLLPKESLLLCLQKLALRDDLLQGKKKLR